MFSFLWKIMERKLVRKSKFKFRDEQKFHNFRKSQFKHREIFSYVEKEGKESWPEKSIFHWIQSQTKVGSFQQFCTSKSPRQAISQTLWMLSSVNLTCQVTMLVMNSDVQLAELLTIKVTSRPDEGCSSTYLLVRILLAFCGWEKGTSWTYHRYKHAWDNWFLANSSWEVLEMNLVLIKYNVELMNLISFNSCSFGLFFEVVL